MSMPLGFHIPLNQSEAQIRRLGDDLLASGIYQWIEIKYPSDLIDWDPAGYLAGIRYLVEQYHPGLSMHLPAFYDLGHWSISLRKTVLDQLKQAIDFALEWGATLLPVHPGTILTMDIPASGDTPARQRIMKAARQKKEKAWALSVGALKDLADHLEGTSGILALENVILPSEIVYTSDQLLRMIREVNHPHMGALLDVGHAFRLGLDPAGFIRDLGRDLIHVHLNDNDGSWDLHQLPGEALLPFENVFKALKDISYGGALVVESIYGGPEDLEITAAFLEDPSKGLG